MPFGMGITELLLIVVLLVVVFGAGRIPEIGRGLGRAIRGFKREMKEDRVDEEGHPELPEDGGNDRR